MKIEQQSDNNVIKFNITIEDGDNDDVFSQINKILDSNQESEENQKISVTFNVPQEYDRSLIYDNLNFIEGREYDIHFNERDYVVINLGDYPDCIDPGNNLNLQSLENDENQNSAENRATEEYISQLVNSTYSPQGDTASSNTSNGTELDDGLDISIMKVNFNSNSGII